MYVENKQKESASDWPSQNASQVEVGEHARLRRLRMSNDPFSVQQYQHDKARQYLRLTKTCHWLATKIDQGSRKALTKPMDWVV